MTQRRGQAGPEEGNGKICSQEEGRWGKGEEGKGWEVENLAGRSREEEKCEG